MFAFTRLFYMCQSLVWRSGGTRFPVLWCAVKSQQLLKKNLAQTTDICRAKPKATLGGRGGVEICVLDQWLCIRLAILEW